MILFSSVSKDLMHFPKPTFLIERRILEVVRLNPKVRGDMVADHLEPVALFVREFLCFLLLREPSVEVGVDRSGNGTNSLS